jgi:hypothetical protein
VGLSGVGQDPKPADGREAEPPLDELRAVMG